MPYSYESNRNYDYSNDSSYNDMNYQSNNYHNYIHVGQENGLPHYQQPNLYPDTVQGNAQPQYDHQQLQYNQQAQYDNQPTQQYNEHPQHYHNQEPQQYDNYPYIRRDTFDEENDLSNSVINTYLRKESGYNEANSDDENDSQSLTTLDKLKIKSQIDNLSCSSMETVVSDYQEKYYNYNDSSSHPERRDTVTRKFKLYKGNFVFDSPISTTLLSEYHKAASQRQDILTNEFKYMRYQAVTCEPNQLLQANFTMRQLQYAVPRETELLITITMYNEDHILLSKTLKGVMKNIRHMVKRNNSNIWGPEAWKKIVVCIVSDGRSKVDEKSLSLLSSLGCYQDGFAKKTINNKQVNAHIYEHTTLMNITDIDEDKQIVKMECDENTVPIQLLFCLKERNQKKINSHRWAFEGFSEVLQPNIITLLDCGTMPGNESIYELWREFKNPQVGGACGEIKTDIGKFGKNLWNPLVASQNFEYKMSNILDKTTESNFGFITVLPGAFSAYRFNAVKGEPLNKYFLGEYMEADQTQFHFFSANMYLAEDRILCFEIVMKRHENWILKYCKQSYATTDVPNTISEFILQRRRWLNGSFFASIYSLCHFWRIWSSGHSVFRKFFLQIEFIYILTNTILAWFALSSFFLVFRILCLSIALTYSTVFNILSVVFFWLYGVLMVSTFILSLGNKPKSTKVFYLVTIIFFAILMCYMIAISCFLTVKSLESFVNKQKDSEYSSLAEQFKQFFIDDNFRNLVISIGSTFVLYIISSVIYLQPMHLLTSFVQYTLLSPSYINVLNIYAFCNLHDISWGTKSSTDNEPSENIASDKKNGNINSGNNGEFEMEVLIKENEIQENYEKHYNNINNITDQPNEKEIDKQETLPYAERKAGYNSNIRSILIILWIVSNFVVVTIVLESGGIIDYALTQNFKHSVQHDIQSIILPKQTKFYFNIILWLVALNAIIRFIGCVLYLVSQPFKKLNHEKRVKTHTV